MPLTIRSPSHVVTSDVIAKNINTNVFLILYTITLICNNLNSQWNSLQCTHVLNFNT